VGLRALADRDFDLRRCGIRLAVIASAASSSNARLDLDNPHPQALLKAAQLQAQAKSALGQFAVSDPHDAVRTECILGFLQLHRSGVVLGGDTYTCIAKTLEDDVAEVRLEAVKVACLCAQIQPEYRIANGRARGGSVRISDAAFAALGA
jgi:hypothetical protein